MTHSSSTGCVKFSLNLVQVTIDTADYPPAHTKTIVIHEKRQAVFREIEAGRARIGKGRPSAPKKRSKVDLLYV